MPVEMLSEALMGRCVTPVSEDHGDKYGVPSLEELGEKTNALTPISQAFKVQGRGRWWVGGVWGWAGGVWVVFGGRRVVGGDRWCSGWFQLQNLC